MHAPRLLLVSTALLLCVHPAIAEASAAPATHDQRKIEGWTVLISKKLLEQEPAATAKALTLLEGHLRGIVERVPATAVQHLREVPLWLSPEYEGVTPKAEYHPDPRWLVAHERDPAMAKAVEFTNIRIFEAECRRMPVFVLHELAHAYHDRVLGFEHAEIKAAYERAAKGGGYDSVQRRDAKGRVSTGRAYALSNEREYFAECTEAFFGENDFFPFNRAELEQHDPPMIELLGRVWAAGSAAASRSTQAGQ